MSMYNLIENSDRYTKISGKLCQGCLWQFYRNDNITDPE